MTKRTHAVQTPGAPAAQADAQGAVDSSAEQIQAQADSAAAGTPDTGAESASAPTEQAKLPSRKAPLTREEQAKLPASAFDPATLTAPALSRDGWVMPSPKG